MTEEKQTEKAAKGTGTTNASNSRPEGESRPLSEREKREALEAILFAAGYAVPYEKLAELLGLTPGKMKRFAEAAAKEYSETPGRGILLVTMEDRCQLCTKAEYKNLIREALGIRLSGKLSASCLEVLAVIAYHQPVTKAYIEQVRGADCSYALGALQDKSLVEPKGRLETPGRPVLYGTTDDFLRCFGLSSLAELPEKPVRGDGSPYGGDGEAAEDAPVPHQLSFLPPEESPAPADGGESKDAG